MYIEWHRIRACCAPWVLWAFALMILCLFRLLCLLLQQDRQPRLDQLQDKVWAWLHLFWRDKKCCNGINLTSKLLELINTEKKTFKWIHRYLTSGKGFITITSFYVYIFSKRTKRSVKCPNFWLKLFCAPKLYKNINLWPY